MYFQIVLEISYFFTCLYGKEYQNSVSVRRVYSVRNCAIVQCVYVHLCDLCIDIHVLIINKLTIKERFLEKKTSSSG